MSLKQYIVANADCTCVLSINTLVFFRGIPQSLTHIPYCLASEAILNTVNTPLGLTCETKQYPMFTWSLKQHLVWRDTQNPDTPSLTSFRCFKFVKQLIGDQLCRTSQHMKRYLQKHCQFSLKVYNNMPNYLYSDAAKTELDR